MENEDIKMENLELFIKVIECINKSGITYWIDQGSLLGLIRNGRFLSWDHDIDIGIWKEDALAIKNILDKEILPRKIRLIYLPYVIKLNKILDISCGSIPINIRVYSKKDEYVYSEFWSVINKEKKIKNLFNRGFNRLSTLSGHMVSKNAAANYGVGRIIIKNIFLLIQNVFLRFREVLKTRRIIFRVEASLLSKFVNYNVYGSDLKVPENAEKYLSLKYGPDWTKPNPNWIWWKEDGAIYKVKYFTHNLKGFFYRIKRSWR